MTEQTADLDDFARTLLEMASAAKDRPPVMSLFVDEESKSVELILDTHRQYYGEWIKGEGGDICLYRDMETHKVVGCFLPLYQRELRVTRAEKEAAEPH